MWTTLMKLDLASVCLALSLGFIFVVLFELIRINSCRGQTPPGPRPLPFVGSIPYFLKNPMEFIRSVSVCFEYRGFAFVYSVKSACYVDLIHWQWVSFTKHTHAQICAGNVHTILRTNHEIYEKNIGTTKTTHTQKALTPSCKEVRFHPKYVVCCINCIIIRI